MPVEKSLKAAEIPDEEGEEAKDQRGDRFVPEAEEDLQETRIEKKDEQGGDDEEEVKRDEADEEEVLVEEDKEDDDEDAEEEEEEKEEEDDEEEEEEGKVCFVLVETYFTLLLLLAVYIYVRLCFGSLFISDSKEKSPSSTSGDKSEYDSSSPLSFSVDVFFAVIGSLSLFGFKQYLFLMGVTLKPFGGTSRCEIFFSA